MEDNRTFIVFQKYFKEILKDEYDEDIGFLTGENFIRLLNKCLPSAVKIEVSQNTSKNFENIEIVMDDCFDMRTSSLVDYERILRDPYQENMIYLCMLVTGVCNTSDLETPSEMTSENEKNFLFLLSPVLRHLCKEETLKQDTMEQRITQLHNTEHSESFGTVCSGISENMGLSFCESVAESENDRSSQLDEGNGDDVVEDSSLAARTSEHHWKMHNSISRENISHHRPRANIYKTHKLRNNSKKNRVNPDMEKFVENKKISKLENDLHIIQDDHKREILEKENLQEQHSNLKKNLDIVMKENTNLKDQLDEVNHQLAKFEKIKKSCENANDKLNTTISQLKIVISEKDDELKQMNICNCELQSRISVYDKKVSVDREAYKEQADINSKLKDKQFDLVKQNEELTKNRDLLLNTINDLHNQSVNRNDRSAIFDSSIISEVSQDVGGDRMDLVLQTQLMEKNSELQQTQSDCRRMENRVSALTTEAEQLRARVGIMEQREQLYQHEELNGHMQQEKAQLEMDENELVARLSELIQSGTLSAASRTMLELKVADVLKPGHKHCQKTLSRMVDKLRTASEQKRSQAGQLELLHQQVELISSEMEGLQDQLNEERRLRVSTELRVDKQTNEVFNYQRTVVDLNRDRQSLSSELTQLRTEYERNLSSLNSLASLVQIYEKQCHCIGPSAQGDNSNKSSCSTLSFGMVEAARSTNNVCHTDHACQTDASITGARSMFGSLSRKSQACVSKQPSSHRKIISNVIGWSGRENSQAEQQSATQTPRGMVPRQPCQGALYDGESINSYMIHLESLSESVMSQHTPMSPVMDPKRIKMIKNRNSQQPQHLKSSYPAEITQYKTDALINEMIPDLRFGRQNLQPVHSQRSTGRSVYATGDRYAADHVPIEQICSALNLRSGIHNNTNFTRQVDSSNLVEDWLKHDLILETDETDSVSSGFQLPVELPVKPKGSKGSKTIPFDSDAENRYPVQSVQHKTPINKNKAAAFNIAITPKENHKSRVPGQKK